MKRRYLFDTNAMSDLIFHRRGIYERTIEIQKQGKLGTVQNPVAVLPNKTTKNLVLA